MPALGKGPFALGKGFAECRTRQRFCQVERTTKILSVKASLPSVFCRALGKGFAEHHDSTR
jgi:hypothetical protein